MEGYEWLTVHRHDNNLSEAESFALAAFAGCAITRECSRLAFAKYGRSLQASDLTEEVATAFVNLFEEKIEGAKL
jgi:ATP-dependent NAD(P)H-hydrate dehydratase